eukprot:3068422-Ditylum_brightwellii.AAC.1
MFRSLPSSMMRTREEITICTSMQMPTTLAHTQPHRKQMPATLSHTYPHRWHVEMGIVTAMLREKKKEEVSRYDKRNRKLKEQKE